jgi:hypothetical protein
MTLATLNLSGTTPVDNEQLNIHSKGFEMTVTNNFKILIGMLFGPGDLDDFNILISFSISFGLVAFRKKLLDCCTGINYITGLAVSGMDWAKLWPILVKKSLKALAMALLSVISLLSLSILEGMLLDIGLKLIICLIPFQTLLIFAL